jgi:ABC-type transporter Mla maintaining outer membrane lipid asymmetry permease subunit MlaE
MEDAWMGLIKPFVFGFIIVTGVSRPACEPPAESAGVGKSTTLSVVAGSWR